MTAETEKIGNVFDDVLQHVRKTAETSLEMQQDMWRQWSNIWPGMSIPQTNWLDQFRRIQKDWSHSLADMARKHRTVMERQHQMAIESLEDALQFAESKDPEEIRRRAEHLCRKTLDCMRELTEAQVHEFQEAVSKWTEMVTKTATP